MMSGNLPASLLTTWLTQQVCQADVTDSSGKLGQINLIQVLILYYTCILLSFTDISLYSLGYKSLNYPKKIFCSETMEKSGIVRSSDNDGVSLTIYRFSRHVPTAVSQLKASAA